MGGLTSLYALHHAPHVFGRAAVFSPSLHFARGAVFDYIRGQQKPQGSRLYVDTGSREVGTGPRSRYIVDSSRRLDNLLRIKGWQPNQDYRWIVDPKGTHSESCWARRFPAAMRFLWGDLV